MRKGLLSAVVVSVFLGVVSLANAAPDNSAKQATTQSAIASPSTSKLNLNTADTQALTTQLTGIGQSKAKAIIAYRETNGPFTAIDELLEVKGIGKALLEKNRDRLEVK